MRIVKNYLRLKDLLRKYGYKNLVFRAIEKFMVNQEYSFVSTTNVTVDSLTWQPLISVVVPVYNTPIDYLEVMIESVLLQSYPNFELCIFNGGSDLQEIDSIVSRFASTDQRIKYKKEPFNEGIAINTNKAIEMASGEYIALLDHDDLLAREALLECAKVITESFPDMIYSDEDKVTSDGSKYLEPHYKPDWSPDTLKSYNYICHFLVVKKEILERINFFEKGVDGSQDYDLVLRISEVTDSIIHIPKILYHWRISENSTAGNSTNKTYTFDAGKKALEKHYVKKGIPVKVSRGTFPPSYSVNFNVKVENLDIAIISVGEWNSNQEVIDYVSKIRKRVKRNNCQIHLINYCTILDIVKEEKIYNFTLTSTSNCLEAINEIVYTTSSEYLFFIDPLIELYNDDWVDTMLKNAVEEETAVIGPKIINKSKVDSYGIAITKTEVINIHKDIPKNFFGYFGRAKISQNISAVSPDVFLIKKSYLKMFGGFDCEYRSLIALLDVCIKARNFGKFVKLVPLEVKKIKNKDIFCQYSEDITYFLKKNRTILLERDFFYPINTIKRK